eukprot:NODE_802_length_1854_cov_37.911986_g248_i1.p1 GENE.NODE_802_length_1854_cov_37.911986_g248_i1~~NODE_802_length_1854_cov_37.911986_g248_i1.p1  ORF type:complete len:484 (-),score=120.98 NODE_802_length_1854_cov_37.911986_g248_i1:152-1603(-)
MWDWSVAGKWVSACGKSSGTSSRRRTKFFSSSPRIPMVRSLKSQPPAHAPAMELRKEILDMMDEAEQYREKVLQKIEKTLLQIEQSEQEFVKIKEMRMEDEKNFVLTANRQLDTQFRDDMSGLEQALAELRSKRELAERERAERDLKELQRSNDLASFLKQLEHHRAALENSKPAYHDLLQYTDLLLKLNDSVTDQIKEFHTKLLQQSGDQSPTLCLQAIQHSAMLYELLLHLVIDKQARIASFDKTIVSHTMLLEFCVDTHDPNAHKHQAVIDQINALRSQCLADIDEHETMAAGTKQQARGFLQTMKSFRGDDLATAHQLREKFPEFFQEMAQLQTTPTKLSPTRPPKTAPGSQFVTSLRSPKSRPASATGSPRIPMVRSLKSQPPAHAPATPKETLTLPAVNQKHSPSERVQRAEVLRAQADSLRRELVPEDLPHADTHLPATDQSHIPKHKFDKGKLLSLESPLEFDHHEFFINNPSQW